MECAEREWGDSRNGQTLGALSYRLVLFSRDKRLPEIGYCLVRNFPQFAFHWQNENCFPEQKRTENENASQWYEHILIFLAGCRTEKQSTVLRTTSKISPGVTTAAILGHKPRAGGAQRQHSQ